jgi:hypothetical protein
MLRELVEREKVSCRSSRRAGQAGQTREHAVVPERETAVEGLAPTSVVMQVELN